MYLQSHIYKKYCSKFWFYNYLKSRSVYVFTLYIPQFTLLLICSFIAVYILIYLTNCIFFPPTFQEHVRDIKWTIDNPHNFVQKYSKKPIKAVIEHVRDGSTVRAFLLPEFYHITLMLSGIRVSSVSTFSKCLALNIKFLQCWMMRLQLPVLGHIIAW